MDVDEEVFPEFLQPQSLLEDVPWGHLVFLPSPQMWTSAAVSVCGLQWRGAPRKPEASKNCWSDSQAGNHPHQGLETALG